MRCEHTHTYAHRTWTGQSHTALCLDSCTKPYHDTRAAFACCVAGPAHRVLSCVSVLSKAISFSVASIDPGSHRHRRGTVRSHTRSHGAQSTKLKGQSLKQSHTHTPPPNARQHQQRLSRGNTHMSVQRAHRTQPVASPYCPVGGTLSHKTISQNAPTSKHTSHKHTCTAAAHGSPCIPTAYCVMASLRSSHPSR